MKSGGGGSPECFHRVVRVQRLLCWMLSCLLHARTGVVQKQSGRLRQQWMLLRPHLHRVRMRHGTRHAHELGVRAHEWAMRLPHEPMRLHRTGLRVQGSEARLHAMLMKMR